mgnify:CR=1 FL=1
MIIGIKVKSKKQLSVKPKPVKPKFKKGANHVDYANIIYTEEFDHYQAYIKETCLDGNQKSARLIIHVMLPSGQNLPCYHADCIRPDLNMAVAVLRDQISEWRYAFNTRNIESL